MSRTRTIIELFDLLPLATKASKARFKFGSVLERSHRELTDEKVSALYRASLDPRMTVTSYKALPSDLRPLLALTQFDTLENDVLAELLMTMRPDSDNVTISGSTARELLSKLKDAQLEHMFETLLKLRQIALFDEMDDG